MIKKTSIKDNILNTLLAPVVKFKNFVCTVGAVVVTFLFIAIIGTTIFFYQLPNIDKMNYDQIKEITIKKVKSRLKNQDNYFKWTPIEEVNRDYLYTIVMAEDANFFTHRGINYDAMIDAMANSYKTGEYEYGASTITQQVAKNIFLSNTKSMFRKLKEYFIAKRLESRFNKNQILELYFNVAEFGPDIYGVRAASFRIFDKSPIDINAAEGAFISLMLPSPKRYFYAIMQNHNISRQNRKKLDRILKDMRYHDFISSIQYVKYKKYDFFKEEKKQ